MSKILFLLFVSIFTSFSIAQKIKTPKKLTGFVYVPAGSFSLGEYTYSVHSFFMPALEVTNFQYHEFLNDLKNQNRLEELKAVIPDTNAWRMSGMYMEPMAQYYFCHPAYSGYPVVNVSVQGAELYCQWLTEKLKELYDNTIIQEVRLPNSNEWTYAAAGGFNNAAYSWGSSRITNEDGNPRGNFKVIGDEFITRSDSVLRIADGFGNNNVPGFPSDDAVIIAPAESYKPNEYGLYNMSGNVSELVKDMAMNADLSITEHGYVAMGGNWNSPGYDIRITSKIAFEQANPFVGFRPIVIVKMPEK